MLSNVVWIDSSGTIKGRGSLGKAELLQMEAVTLPEGEAMYVLSAEEAASWNGQMDDLLSRVLLVVIGARCCYLRTALAKPPVHEHVDGWPCRALPAGAMDQLVKCMALTQ